MKKYLTIVALAAVTIALAATAALFVLTAYAGEQSGLHRCATPGPAVARMTAASAYGAQLAQLGRCQRWPK